MNPERYPHLPPLNTLLVFEAAARNESFVKAADELCLTASAVAHQIKKLEASLGMTLFIRHARGVNLSLQSREYYGHIQQHLNEINRHSEQIKDFSLRPLKISTQHAIAQLWLQPRLGEYQDQYNDREMEIIAQSRIGNSPTDVDIAISYFPEPPSGKAWHLLWEESLVPVCQPEYKQHKPVLYQDAHWSDDWHAWQQQSALTDSNLPRFNFSSIRSASLYVLVLQSVMDKRGIMVARQTLLQDYLQSGKLVTWPASDTPAVTYGAYYMYQSPASLNNPFANDFREWLVQKIGGSQEHPLRFTLLSQQAGHHD
jgi:LysR family glycine cleavage system transcriptional activator